MFDQFKQRELTTPDEEIALVVIELARELRQQHPPVKGSLALEPWICRHNVSFENWYFKEVACELLHR